MICTVAAPSPAASVVPPTVTVSSCSSSVSFAEAGLAPGAELHVGLRNWLCREDGGVYPPDTDQRQGRRNAADQGEHSATGRTRRCRKSPSSCSTSAMAGGPARPRSKWRRGCRTECSETVAGKNRAAPRILPRTGIISVRYSSALQVVRLPHHRTQQVAPRQIVRSHAPRVKYVVALRRLIRRQPPPRQRDQLAHLPRRGPRLSPVVEHYRQHRGGSRFTDDLRNLNWSGPTCRRWSVPNENAPTRPALSCRVLEPVPCGGRIGSVRTW